MENGLVNLACIVGLLIFSIGTIPLVLFLGTQRQTALPDGRAGAEGESPEPEHRE